MASALAVETLAAIANRIVGQEYLVDLVFWVCDCFMVILFVGLKSYETDGDREGIKRSDWQMITKEAIPKRIDSCYARCIIAIVEYQRAQVKYCHYNFDTIDAIGRVPLLLLSKKTTTRISAGSHCEFEKTDRSSCTRSKRWAWFTLASRTHLFEERCSSVSCRIRYCTRARCFLFSCPAQSEN